MSILYPSILKFRANLLRSTGLNIRVTDLFNGFDINGYTVSGASVVPDQSGALRITTAGSLACEGGYWDVATSTWRDPVPTPTKKSIRTLTGSKVVYKDTDPTIWKRATVNPTRTNKVTCRKINPVDTTNIAKSGDAAAVLSVVDDTAALAAAGLDKICTSGKVYKLDNSLGVANADVYFVGNPNNTNLHSLRVHVRGNGVARLLLGSGAGYKTQALTATYTEFRTVSATPSSTVDRMYTGCTAGSIVYFILPQLEEGAFCTDPIIDIADPLAAITRTGTNITKPTAGLFPMVSETEAQNFGIYMRFTLKGLGSDLLYPFSISTADGDLTYCVITDTLLMWRRRISTINYTASVPLTPTADVPVEALGIYTDTGIAVKIRQFIGGVWGAWSNWGDYTVNKAPAKIGPYLAIGSVNNSLHTYANFPLLAILKLGNQATLADYQAVAEAEVLKINTWPEEVLNENFPYTFPFILE